MRCVVMPLVRIYAHIKLVTQAKEGRARMLLKRGTGNGERGTEVWERVVSGNLHKNPIWPMIDDREPSKQT